MGLSANILLIDDDVEILKVIELTLKRAGYRVYKASNWQVAEEAIVSATRSKESFDLVILDLMMPERSGYDMMDYLKIMLHPLPPILILSALNGIGDAVKAYELGAVKYLTKPTTKETLLKTIREILRKKSSFYGFS